MRTLLPVTVLFGCSDKDDATTDRADTDVPTYTTTDVTAESGSGHTDTPPTGVPPDCDVAAEPIHVEGIGGFTELQAALDAAEEGARILVCRGTYPGPFIAPVAVNLFGADGADFTILDGGGLGTTLTLQPQSSLTGIRLTGGAATAGGGLLLTGAGMYEIAASAVVTNTAEEGGGIWAAPGARVWLPGTVVADNTADRGGGIYADLDVDIHLTDGRIEANTADDNGGGLYALADLNLEGGTVSKNVALSADDTAGGGGVYNVGGGAVLGATITENEAFHGAGIRADDATLLDLTAAVVTGNIALESLDASSRGGGLYVDGGQVVVDNGSSFSANEADFGGGVFVTGEAVVSGAIVTANTAVSGGGVYVLGGTATMVTVTDNSADSGGGVVIDDAGTVSASTIGANTALAEGGGVLAGAWLADSLGLGLLELSSVIVTDNLADTGGGIAVTGEVTLTVTEASFVEGNTATTAGGGAWVADTAVLSSDTSNWGDAANENVPDDLVAGTTAYSGYTTSETFTCVDGTCTPAP